MRIYLKVLLISDLLIARTDAVKYYYKEGKEDTEIVSSFHWLIVKPCK